MAAVAVAARPEEAFVNTADRRDGDDVSGGRTDSRESAWNEWTMMKGDFELLSVGVDGGEPGLARG